MRKPNLVHGVDGDGVHHYRGSFAPNGSGAVDVTLNRTTRGGGSARCGFTAARTGVGVYTVTLDDGIAEFVGAVPYAIACPAGTTVQGGIAMGAVLAGPGTQFTILTFDGTEAAADIAAAAGRRLEFDLMYRISRVF